MINSTGVKFTVGELDGGTPFIQMWADRQALGIPDEPAVFEVKSGSSMAEVESIVSFLNQNIVSISLHPSEPRHAFQTEVK